ncbi:hypothetical protein Vretimale_5687 [Volvox reticuliferus]|uniref:Uncharacterized protein n=1 Tax=Volvox reticuliferus TaxID=1737510 RepID=A0A8J4LKQ3_9CHLO|nr:hypothetical protein Vretifemale_5782 [Volvox reticuliferus]GIM00758.1 hypothetical protein Vretimale_5687 [Volvox reticuliferus]
MVILFFRICAKASKMPFHFNVRGWGWTLLQVIIIVATCYDFNHAMAASCAGGKNCSVESLHSKTATDTGRSTWRAKKDTSAELTALVAWAWPFVKPLGISGFVGYACGLFVRRVIQVMVLGLAFVISAVQVLAYFNWVTVHWDRINSDLAKLLGEGRNVTNSDEVAGLDALLAVAFERLATVLSTGLPSLAGFATGLTLAFMPGMALA